MHIIPTEETFNTIESGELLPGQGQLKVKEPAKFTQKNPSAHCI